jgi:hypothetical protein
MKEALEESKDSNGECNDNGAKLLNAHADAS